MTDLLPRDLTTIADVTPDDLNANQGSPRGQALLESSLSRLGAGRSIVTDRHGRVIAGNKTLEAAASLGLDNLVVVRTRGDQLVVVQREDLDMDTDPRARELAIADNRVGQVNLVWNEAVLAELDGMGVDLEQFWTRDELDRLLAVVGEPEPGPDVVDDPDALDQDASNLQTKWGVQPGDIWVVPSKSGKRGLRHRVACGHPADVQLVSALLGPHTTPLLLVTEPPVSLDANGRDPFLTDVTMEDWTSVYDLWDASVLYVWHRPAYAQESIIALQAAQYRIAQQLVWLPGTPVETSGHYQLRHLACWYALNPQRSASWSGDRQESVWTLKARTGAGRPGMRPPELFRPAMRHHSPLDALVVDPFAGLGSVLIAAELEGRPSISLDADPFAVAVALERAVKMGLTPVKQEPANAPT